MNSKNEIYDAVLFSIAMCFAVWLKTESFSNMLFVWPAAFCFGTALVYYVNLSSFHNKLSESNLSATQNAYLMCIIKRMKRTALLMALVPFVTCFAYLVLLVLLGWFPYLGPKAGVLYLAPCMAFWLCLYNRYDDDASALYLG